MIVLRELRKDIFGEDTDYTVIASDQFQLIHYVPKHWFDIIVDYRRDF
jgi:hypothetical protein